jgi:hypothetical protein
VAEVAMVKGVHTAILVEDMAVVVSMREVFMVI